MNMTCEARDLSAVLRTEPREGPPTGMPTNGARMNLGTIVLGNGGAESN